MKIKSYFPVVLMAGMALASCPEDTENFDNAVFAPSLDNVTTISVKASSETLTGYVEANLAKKSDTDVPVTFYANPAKVADYNAIYSKDYLELPSKYYRISQSVVTIPAGANTTGKVAVDFINLGELDVTSTYVLPVSISCPFGSLSNDTYYFIIREAAMVSVVADLNDNFAVFLEGNQAIEMDAMNQITVQALLYPRDFRNQLNTLMGIEGQYLLRFGDNGVPPNQLQLATSNGNVTDASWQLDTNSWTEFTFTFDCATGEAKVYFNGVKKGATQISDFRGPIDWNTASGDITDGPRGFYIGYSYNSDRCFDGNMAEVRVWNRVLTEEEINQPFQAYSVEPDSPGLVAYWKLDEGSGNLFHDYANGYDLKCNAAPGWIPVALPEK